MKKKVVMLFLGMTILFMASCGVTSNKPENNSTEIEVETELEEQKGETVYSIGDSAILKDWGISVTDVQVVESIKADYGSFSPKEEGDKYIQVFVTVTNNGKEADTFLPTVGLPNSVKVKVLYDEGYEFSASNLLGYRNDMHDSTINPLSSRTGEIAFTIPDSVASSTEELLLQFASGKKIVKFKIR